LTNLECWHRIPDYRK